jgi:hypothetical protein
MANDSQREDEAEGDSADLLGTKANTGQESEALPSMPLDESHHSKEKMNNNGITITQSER